MVYTEKHEVEFTVNGETRNSYTDWQLVPTSRPFIAPPEVQKFSTVLDAKQGEIDYYKSIIDYPIYRNRTGTIEFLIDHESPDYKVWHFTYDQVMNFLHGKHGKMILRDQPDYYYEGLFTVDSFGANSDWSTITIGYDVWPMKKSILDSLEPWLWDPFSFVTGIIRFGEDYRIKLNESEKVDYTVTDVRGISEVQLSFDDNNIADSTIRLDITNWDPIAGDVTRNLYITNNDKGNPITFILYPGHETFSLTWQHFSTSSLTNLNIDVHFREGIL